MEVIYGLIPGMLLAGLAIFGILVWAARSGQYDDLEGPANRILMDDDDPLLPEATRLRRQSASGEPNRKTSDHTGEGGETHGSAESTPPDSGAAAD
ncbi:MAG: cbb3-type cytochrome oxidase assembly protein CcoS [Proteobacteria bacterium]|nr:MAG: cbb3-type cytochrome oxidase assembly protein CcoS [Pseudomonadota bacterium]QKK10470.1 MAG: cbb3-type cytochrome oxidase assembly protein CcoS [Pseudomonadota bacterium]